MLNHTRYSSSFALVFAGFLSIGCESAYGQEGFKWDPIPQGRMAALNPVPLEEDGFKNLDPESLGIRFVNELEKKYQDLNQNLLNGSGVALGDVNGDERCDLFFAGLNSDSRLYLNQGNWTFIDATKSSGIDVSNTLATGVMLEDVDGDGDLDLLVNGNGTGTRLWHNDGTGKFTEATPASFKSRTGPTSFSLADVNGDHRLDLYVANYGENTIRSGAAVNVRTVRGKQVVTGRWRERIEIIDGQMVEFGEPNHLFIQDTTGQFNLSSWKEGRFEHSNGSTILEAYRDLSLSAMFHDLNKDGLPDLYVCNDFHSPDRIWMNQGDGRFRAIEKNIIRTTSHFSMGVDITDVDRNGWDDLFVVDMLSRSHLLRMTQKTEMSPNPNYLDPLERLTSQVRRNTLLIRRDDGSYAELARFAGVEASDWSWCPVFMDVDLDGWQDLLVVNGHAIDALDSDTLEKRNTLPSNSPQRRMMGYPELVTANVAFRNLGDLTFEPMGETWHFNSTRIGNGMALGDLDHDGDLDVVVNCLNAPPLIYRNNASKPRVAVRLKGPAQNTSGIGGRIRLLGSGKPQEQEMIAGGRYLSDDQNVRVFAVSDSEANHRMEVIWPDGSQTLLPDIKSGYLYEISAATAGPSKALTQEQLEPIIQPLFAKSDRSIPLTTDSKIKMDWEWQPAVNRSLNRRGLHAVIQANQKTGNDELRIPSFMLAKNTKQSESAKDDLSFHEAMAWVNDQLETRISFHSIRSQQATTLRRTPINATAAFAIADVDQDGDRDVFVGMPPLPGKYPLSGGSQLLIHEGGNFRPQSTSLFDDLGNVQDVVFCDVDGNGWQDLLIAAEWSPIRIFMNQNGQFTERTDAWGLSPHKGGWNALTPLDVDHDGDLDFVAGNWGNNTRYASHIEHPIRWYYGDVNKDGFMEGMESYYDPERKAWLPMDGLERQELVFATIRQYFPTHRAFADATVTQIWNLLELPDQYVEITTLDSMLFIQRDGAFIPQPLPTAAQWAPVNDIVAADFDLNGDPDLFLAQNEEQVPDHLSRIDAGQGLILMGDGEGQFHALSPEESGIHVHAEQTSAWVGDANGDQRPDIWVQTPDSIDLYLGVSPNY